MDQKTIVKIIFIIGLIVVASWLFKFLIKFFIPAALILGGVYVYYKYIKPQR